jgi:hypothetical protein
MHWHGIVLPTVLGEDQAPLCVATSRTHEGVVLEAGDCHGVVLGHIHQDHLSAARHTTHRTHSEQNIKRPPDQWHHTRALYAAIAPTHFDLIWNTQGEYTDAARRSKNASKINEKSWYKQILPLRPFFSAQRPATAPDSGAKPLANRRGARRAAFATHRICLAKPAAEISCRL